MASGTTSAFAEVEAVVSETEAEVLQKKINAEQKQSPRRSCISYERKRFRRIWGKGRLLTQKVSSFLL